MTHWALSHGGTNKASIVRDRRVEAVGKRSPGPAIADAAAVRRSEGQRRSWLLGALGYAVHGVALVVLALWALDRFGQVFWFFSLIAAALGATSLYDAFVAFTGMAEPTTREQSR